VRSRRLLIEQFEYAVDVIREIGCPLGQG